MRIGMPARLAASTTCGDLVRAADVPRVDAHGGDAGVDRLQREARVEVDVGDHRERREADDRRSASASSVFGTAQRTSSQPAEASAAICAVVASTSRVGVSVIDWTTTGAPPPIGDVADR